MQIKRNILLNPGPTTTTDTVKMALVVPDICPREKEFVHVMADVRNGLLKVVNADDDYTCILFAGSGTAAMDAVINSVVPPDKKILIINNGAYGERMVKIAKAYNMGCVELKFPWTERPDLTKVEKTLEDDSKITHIAIVHHETTTGLLNPLKEMVDIARSRGKTLIADTISSFAGIPIDVRSDHMDFMISTSNKCIQSMAGVSFVLCKKSEIEKTARYPLRSFYLNLYQQYKYFEEHGEMQFTPPVQVIYALRQAIKEYFEEGIENRYHRYCHNWKVLTHGLKDLGFRLLLKEEIHSKILTTVIEPDHERYDFDLLHDLLIERGFTIYPGKIHNNNTFRIANMGSIDHKDMEAFLEALANSMDKIGIKEPLYK